MNRTRTLFFSGLLTAAIAAGCHKNDPAPVPMSSIVRPAPAYSFAQQQGLWQEWLQAAETSATGDPEGSSLLQFLKQRVIVTDGTKPLLSPPPPDHFYGIVLTDDNTAFGAPWSDEVSRMIRNDVFASYHSDTTTLLVREQKLPLSIKGSVLLHETAHAFHFQTKWKNHELTRVEHGEEERSAFTMQCRLFRKSEGKHYEEFRKYLYAILNSDVQKRTKMAKTEEEEMFANFPSPLLLPTIPGDTWDKAFGNGKPLDIPTRMTYSNFAFMDVGLQIIKDNFTEKDAKIMQTAFILDLEERSQSHP